MCRPALDAEKRSFLPDLSLKNKFTEKKKKKRKMQSLSTHVDGKPSDASCVQKAFLELHSKILVQRSLKQLK